MGLFEKTIGRFSLRTLAVLPLAFMAGKAAPAGVSAPQGFDPVLVGQSGVVQPITFPASVTDITLSFPGDFSLGAIDCTTTVGSCAVPVTFSPRYPGLRQSAVIAQDENQNVIGTVFVHGIGLGPQASEHPGVISTAAGNGTWGNGGDGGEATQANLASPQGIAVDTQGRLFIVDSGNEVVRKVSGGIINTIQGTAGLFSAPTGLALDAAGNIYVADSDHNEVLKIDALTRAVTVLAGGGNIGGGNITSGWGDGGPATNAILSGPTDVAVDAAGNVFIADTDHGLIRKVDAAGNISTIAGVAPALHTPQGLALDAGGNLYIADTGHNAIRYMILSTGVVSTIAGTGTAGYSGDSGPALQAQLNAPTGLSVDAAGDVYIADTGNNVIREVLAGSGVITTVAGDSLQGFTPDGGSPLSAQFYGPRNVALDSAGDLFVSDNGNSVVRKITFALQGMNFGTVNVGLTSPAENQTVFNIGNRPLDFSALSIPSNFWQDIANAWVNCSASSVVLPGTGCVISVQFVPTAADTVTENLSFTTNSLNAVGLSQQTANLTGTGAPEAVPKLQLSPASLIFPAQSVGSVSAPQTVVITNIGSAVLNNASVLLSGVGAGSFQFMGGASCGTLQAGQSCSVSVIFSPQATGAQTAVISFTNALANSPQVQVSGTATPVGNLLLPQGASLNVGSALLVMQGDGNLVLYQNGAALWNSGTPGQNCGGQCFAAFQGDGNFVVYNGPTAIWNSGTPGSPGAQLALSNQTPHIQIVGSNRSIFWADSYTFRAGTLVLPQGASVNMGSAFLVMQGDGNLVLYQNGVALWNSGTPGQNCGVNRCFAAFQGDGNFVVYNGPTAIWNSGTPGNSGAQLVLSNPPPHIRIIGNNQSILW